MQYLLIIGPTVVILILIWIIVGRRHLRYLRSVIKAEWELVNERLKKRQSLVPNLVETVRQYDQNQDQMLEKMIEIRLKAAKEYIPGAKKIEYEYELSQSINRVIDLGRTVTVLSQDTNFLELRKEINDLEKEIEERASTHNKMLRAYNMARESWYLKPIAKMFHLGFYDIFEVEM